jgi:endonuclease/exonuclease/phosphatase family metal-dependent hydrolase
MLLGVDAPASSRVPVKSAVLTRNVPVEISDARAGEVRILTYNVAGLPRIVVGERAKTMRRIGRLLNDFDVVLIQEDFSWHTHLAQEAEHAFRSRPGRRGFAILSDGLSTFSSKPFDTIHRVPWEACNGIVSASTDCLGSKGFSVAEITLAKGATVHVYNLHADAGSSNGDLRARKVGYAQLAAFIKEHSAGHAVIVAGDTNLRRRNVDDLETMQRFLDRTDLIDACQQTECPHVQIDRVLYRSSSSLALTATSWERDERFMDDDGQAFSDHPAIAVTIGWRKR